MIAFGKILRDSENNNGMKEKRQINRCVANLIIEYSLRYHSLKSTYNKRRYIHISKRSKKKNSSQIHGKAKRESLFYKQTNENTIKPEK